MSKSFSLDLKHWGLRFLSSGTEREYRTWRNEQNVPVYKLVVAVSIPAWMLPIPVGWVYPQITWLTDFYRVSFGLMIPLLIGGWVNSYLPTRRYGTWVSALILTMAGSSFLWLMTTVEVAADTTGIAVAFTISFAAFALYMRLPPLAAIVSVAPFVIATYLVVVSRIETGVIAAVYAVPYALALSTLFFFIAVMSVVNERFFRQAYVNEQSLKHSRALIGRYVPPALAQEIIGGNVEGIEAPQRRRVTILFSDIVGFTNMADRVEPEVMTEVLGGYMSTMVGLIEQQGGTVNEFAGDGLMALFGAPNPMTPEQQAQSAIRAAQTMQATMTQLNQGWRKLGLGAELKLRIGINTGIVSVGSYGSQGRMTYTAIGLHTNIASRIEHAAEPGETLISDATYQLISDEIPCEPKGEVECKGVHFPIAVYAPA